MSAPLYLTGFQVDYCSSPLQKHGDLVFVRKKTDKSCLYQFKVYVKQLFQVMPKELRTPGDKEYLRAFDQIDHMIKEIYRLQNKERILAMTLSGNAFTRKTIVWILAQSAGLHTILLRDLCLSSLLDLSDPRYHTDMWDEALPLNDRMEVCASKETNTAMDIAKLFEKHTPQLKVFGTPKCSWVNITLLSCLEKNIPGIVKFDCTGCNVMKDVRHHFNVFSVNGFHFPNHYMNYVELLLDKTFTDDSLPKDIDPIQFRKLISLIKTGQKERTFSIEKLKTTGTIGEDLYPLSPIEPQLLEFVATRFHMLTHLTAPSGQTYSVAELRKQRSAWTEVLSWEKRGLIKRPPGKSPEEQLRSLQKQMKDLKLAASKNSLGLAIGLGLKSIRREKKKERDKS